MVDPTLEQIRQWLKAHEQDLLHDTLQMLRIPSIEGDPEPNAPFGRANRDALDLALGLAEKYGMRTKDLEGYAGYAEFGPGDRLVVSLGHLDVVPVGAGWKHEPFGAEIDGDYIYSRGTVDDKGPTMASFYAVRALMECAPNLPARIRQVFGCNEESGFRCVERYAQTEEPPTFGVAPDSGWPLYHAEKGIANLVITLPARQGELEILELCGGQRPNIVIDSCQCTVRVADRARRHVEEKLADSWDKNVTFLWSGDTLEIRAVGKAAHGSTPFLGDSAGTRLFRFLLAISPLSDERYFEQLLLSTHPSGVGIGIHGGDDVSQDLTSNLGTVELKGNRIELLYNVRYPVTWTGEKLEGLCRDYLKGLEGDWRLDVTRDSPPLYFPLDHPMVKTICEVVEEETGERKPPGTMGGGTYARALPNTVSIGTGWEGDGNAHETDERLKIEHLFRMSRIYAHILYRLAMMETEPTADSTGPNPVQGEK
jgi:succinyl-diaminopimelate desuccinylase